MSMPPNAGYLGHLAAVIESRRGASPEESYVAKMLAKGRAKIAQKVGEEAVEVALASVAEGKGEVIGESADLLFHLLLLWAESDVRVEEVFAEMRRRESGSGLEEKKNRKL